MEADQSIAGWGFPQTRWTKVYMASDPDREEGLGALVELLRTYRPVLHHYLLHRYPGIAPEEVEDWVSGFIERKILQEDLLQLADKDKGRFRTFLVTSLNRFAADQRRHGSRARRQPTGGMVSIEECDELPCGKSGPNPGDQAWARKVIEEAFRRAAGHYRRKGRDRAWELFLEGFYQPLLEGGKALPQQELAAKHGFDSATEVSNRIGTIKRHFGETLREVVREYETTEAGVDDEIRELIAVVSTGR